MRQKGWSSKHPKKEDGSRQSIQPQAIAGSSSRGDYAHWLVGRKGRLHSGTHGRLQDGARNGFPTEGQGRATTFPTLNGYPRGGEAVHGPTVTEGTLKTPMLSAMQVKKGLKREEVTYLATLKEEKDDGSGRTHS
ncbi:hypothetical protein CK203_078826 [Vitis vinifera]|uniref:Uncharacterized protein n=1 Tax=Vitis vinifera TaxID=29760 RepID=A0A438FCP7_VITVI|nr:hypothetical protein CK203_078826 [Vitis vinifera]